MFDIDLRNLARVAAFASAGYVVLLSLIRLFGPRTIAKMNPSDLAVTAALGSPVAILVLFKHVALAEGVVALTVLIGLQAGTAWLSVRSTAFRSDVGGAPALLFSEGRFTQAIKREHVNEAAVYKAIRELGITDIEKVQAVILEIDGSFTIIPFNGGRAEIALYDVKRPPAN